MSEEAKRQLDAAMAERRKARRDTEDTVYGWFREFVQALNDSQLGRLYRHFEIIQNLKDDGSLGP